MSTVLHEFVVTQSVEQLREQLVDALALNRGVLIQGVSGSGKSALVQHVVSQLRPDQALLRVCLDDAFDGKDLQGRFTAGKTPGHFAWAAGPLTAAARDGQVLLLEDIDLASFDVMSCLLPLLQGASTITVPEQGITIPVHPDFRLLATQQLVATARAPAATAGAGATAGTPTATGGVAFRRGQAVLGAELWCPIVVPHPTDAEVAEIARVTCPALDAAAVQKLSQMVVSCGAATSAMRGVIKWARRLRRFVPALAAGRGFISSTLREAMLREAIDCFVAWAPASRAGALVTAIADALEVQHEVALAMLQQHKPQIVATPRTWAVGRVQFQAAAAQFDRALSRNFAETKPALTLLERLASAVVMEEPVLLTGETGVGKTFMVQFLADSVGKRLIVHNVNQQTDSADFVGGWKPKDVSTLVRDFYRRFVDLFRASFDAAKNATFLERLEALVRTSKWPAVGRSFETGVKAARNAVAQLPPEMQARWDEFEAARVADLVPALAAEATRAFVFEEGSLVTAWREGHWLLIDEINLASTEVLERIASIVGSEETGLLLTERGDLLPIQRHPDFRVFGNMNPPTDVGKKDLPPALRARFTEFYVEEPLAPEDIAVVVRKYLDNLTPDPPVQGVVDFYLECKRNAGVTLSDGEQARPPHFSLRTLSRALSYTRVATQRYGFRLALLDGLTMCFATALERRFHEAVRQLMSRLVFKNAAPVPQRPAPPQPVEGFVPYEHLWLAVGPLPPVTPKDFIVTPSVCSHLLNVCRAVAANRPVLLEGPTSSGKSSMVMYLAQLTGHRCVRINNHESTEVQEYLGYFVSAEDGSLRFVDGALVQAVRAGDWVILDELNLAPTEILEALNRLLDDNGELFIPDTQEVVKAHPSFRVFATQNPAGAYGGRKLLSRALRNRFLEVFVDEIPTSELTEILVKRFDLAPPFAAKMVESMTALQVRRQASQIFAGKHGFITPRDLLRWAERHPTTYQELAEHGFLLLGERCRKDADRQTVKDVLETVMRVTIDDAQLYEPSHWPSIKAHYERALEMQRAGELSTAANVVWTAPMRRLFTVTGLALQHQEPVLLVGETGSSKTTVCQLWAEVLARPLTILNCHQHVEASDFVGAMRPAPPQERDSQLFRWVDGPLVTCLRTGAVFVLDEISLAEDAVLERLNAVLEPGRTMTLSETTSAEVVRAVEAFRVMATMNPGGDFGKRELSPALRNRFTEIFVQPVSTIEDAAQILRGKLVESLASDFAVPMATVLLSVARITAASPSRHISVRDIVGWTQFMNATAARCDPRAAFFQGADAVLIDGWVIGSGMSEAAAVELNTQILRAVVAAYCTTGAVETYESAQEVIAQPFWEQCSGVPHPEVLSDDRGRVTYCLNSPATRRNTSKLLRAMVLAKPVLLEGPPGVGKTTIVDALGRALGKRVVRINFSDQTDIADLFGTFLPAATSAQDESPHTVEAETADAAEAPRTAGGQRFVWCDGALLSAVRNGDWVILDELNLATQTVLEGLNSLFDHRGTVYLPETGMEVKAHPDFRAFGCQNPVSGGGGRKGLPKSFVNRFSKVSVEALTAADMSQIVAALHPQMEDGAAERMVGFVDALSRAATIERTVGQRGGPWEFNLRDTLRWATMMRRFSDSRQPERFVEGLFVRRFRTEEDRAAVRAIFSRVFGGLPVAPRESIALSDTGAVTLDGVAVTCAITDADAAPTVSADAAPLLLLPEQEPVVADILRSVEIGNFVLLSGPAAAGKTKTLEVAARLAGRILHTYSVAAGCDTVDLLGGFSQDTDSADAGLAFVWRDSVIVTAMERGDWVVLDNANFCAPSVLDRLNPLVEPNGYLSLNEQGLVAGRIREVHPHPNFRIFAVCDPKFGEVSRALRNRAVEIYVPAMTPNALETRVVLSQIVARGADADEPAAVRHMLDSWRRYLRRAYGVVDGDRPRLGDAISSGAPSLRVLLRMARTRAFGHTHKSALRDAVVSTFLLNRFTAGPELAAAFLGEDLPSIFESFGDWRTSVPWEVASAAALASTYQLTSSRDASAVVAKAAFLVVAGCHDHQAAARAAAVALASLRTRAAESKAAFCALLRDRAADLGALAAGAVEPALPVASLCLLIYDGATWLRQAHARLAADGARLSTLSNSARVGATLLHLLERAVACIEALARCPRACAATADRVPIASELAAKVAQFWAAVDEQLSVGVITDATFSHIAVAFAVLARGSEAAVNALGDASSAIARVSDLLQACEAFGVELGRSFRLRHRLLAPPSPLQTHMLTAFRCFVPPTAGATHPAVVLGRLAADPAWGTAVAAKGALAASLLRLRVFFAAESELGIVAHVAALAAVRPAQQQPQPQLQQMVRVEVDRFRRIFEVEQLPAGIGALVVPGAAAPDDASVAALSAILFGRFDPQVWSELFVHGGAAWVHHALSVLRDAHNASAGEFLFREAGKSSPSAALVSAHTAIAESTKLSITSPARALGAFARTEAASDMTSLGACEQSDLAIPASLATAVATLNAEGTDADVRSALLSTIQWAAWRAHHLALRSPLDPVLEQLRLKDIATSNAAEWERRRVVAALTDVLVGRVGDAAAVEPELRSIRDAADARAAALASVVARPGAESSSGIRYVALFRQMSDILEQLLSAERVDRAAAIAESPAAQERRRERDADAPAGADVNSTAGVRAWAGLLRQAAVELVRTHSDGFEDIVAPFAASVLAASTAAHVLADVADEAQQQRAEGQVWAALSFPRASAADVISVAPFPTAGSRRMRVWFDALDCASTIVARSSAALALDVPAARQVFTAFNAVFARIAAAEQRQEDDETRGADYKATKLIIEGDDEAMMRRMAERFPSFVQHFEAKRSRRGAADADDAADGAEGDADSVGESASDSDSDSDAATSAALTAKVMLSERSAVRISRLLSAHATFFAEAANAIGEGAVTSTLQSAGAVRDAGVVHSDVFRQVAPSQRGPHGDAFVTSFDSAAEALRVVERSSLPADWSTRVKCGVATRARLAASQITHAVTSNQVADRIATETNMYTEPDPAEVLVSLKILGPLRRSVADLLAEYPDNAVLMKIMLMIQRVERLEPFRTPLMKCLTGVELLLRDCFEWERSASRATSLAHHLQALASVVLRWRRLELHSWPHVFHSAVRAHAAQAFPLWCALSDVVRAAERGVAFEPEAIAQRVHDAAWSASIGQFGTVLLILESFAREAAVLSASNRASPLRQCAALLSQLHGYFSQFAKLFESALATQTKPIEEELRDFVTLMRWEDATYHALRAATEKSHLQIARLLARYEDAISRPVLQVLEEDDQRREKLGHMGLDPIEAPAAPAQKLSRKAVRFNEAQLAKETTAQRRKRVKEEKRKRKAAEADAAAAVSSSEDDEDFAASPLPAAAALADFVENVSADVVENVEGLQASTYAHKTRALKMLFERVDREAPTPLLVAPERYAATGDVGWGAFFADSTVLLSGPAADKVAATVAIHGTGARRPLQRTSWGASRVHLYRAARELQRMRNARRNPHADLSDGQVARVVALVESVFSSAVSWQQVIVAWASRVSELEYLQSVAAVETVPTTTALRKAVSSAAAAATAATSLAAQAAVVDEPLSAAVQAHLEALRTTGAVVLAAVRACAVPMAAGWHIATPAVESLKTATAALRAAASAFAAEQGGSLVALAFAQAAADIDSPAALALQALDAATTARKAPASRKSSPLVNGVAALLKATQSAPTAPTASATGSSTSLTLWWEDLRTALIALAEATQVELSARGPCAKSTSFATAMAAAAADLNRLGAVLLRGFNAFADLAFVLARTFTAIFERGFCKQEGDDNEGEGEGEGDGAEGATQDGTGMDDGKGNNDVTDQLDNEDQLMNMKDMEQQKQDDKDQKGDDEEDKAADVETDFQADKDNLSEDDDEDDSDSDDGSEEHDDAGDVDKSRERNRKRARTDSDDGDLSEDSNDGEDDDEVSQDDFDSQDGDDENDEETGGFENREEAIKRQEDAKQRDDKDLDLVADEKAMEGEDGEDDADKDGGDESQENSDAEDEVGSDKASGGEDGSDDGSDDGKSDRAESVEREGAEGTPDQEHVDDEDGAKDGEEGDADEEREAFGQGESDEEHEGGQQDQQAGNEENQDAAQKQKNQRAAADANGVEQEQPSSEQQISDTGRSWKKKDPNEKNKSQRKDKSRDERTAHNKEAKQERHTDKGQKLSIEDARETKKQRDDDAADADKEQDAQDGPIESDYEFDSDADALGTVAQKRQDATTAEQPEDESDEDEDAAAEEPEAAEDALQHRKRMQKVARVDEEAEELDEDAAEDSAKPKKSRKGKRAMQAKPLADDDDAADAPAEPPAPEETPDEAEERRRRARQQWFESEAATQPLAQQLCEQLRMVLAPTVADKLQGDYKTGKRINMKKIVGYIASGYKKDKIWLRRTRPNKRSYQIVVAVDDSESMALNGADTATRHALALLCKAMQQLDVGELGLVRFGDGPELMHGLGTPFTTDSGPSVFEHLTFGQKATHMHAFLEQSLDWLDEARERALSQTRSTHHDHLQVLFILSDGHLTENRTELRRLMARAEANHQVVVFLILDIKAAPAAAADAEGAAAAAAAALPSADAAGLSEAERMRRAKAARETRLAQRRSAGGPNACSILDMQIVEFKGKQVVKKSYLEGFPFPTYVIVQQLPQLPEILADTLRQWFELFANASA